MNLNSPQVFIIAGEPSGDFLGGKLIESLHSAHPSLSIAGIGGQHMTAQGLNSLFPMQELSVMGLSEIIPHAFKIKRRIKQTADWIQHNTPQVLVTIDSPGFCLRVVKALKTRGINLPVVHYVAPSVWAWRPGRAKKLAHMVEHLLTLFPFEPPYFEKEGLSTTFVGHAAIEMNLHKISSQAFRKSHKIPMTTPLLCLLPGSRRGEISQLLPIFLGAAKNLSKAHPNLEIVIPTLPHLIEEIRKISTSLSPNLSLRFVTKQEEKYQAMRASTIALAASGTISLELALCQLPMAIAYKVSPITAWIVKRLVRIKHVCLVNILLDRGLVPEHLQTDCTVPKITETLESLLSNETMRHQQLAGFSAIQQLLQNPPLLPSARAAEIILTYMKKSTTLGPSE